MGPHVMLAYLWDKLPRKRPQATTTDTTAANTATVTTTAIATATTTSFLSVAGADW